MLDKISKTKIELIHMFTCYKLLLILGLIPICNVISGEWLSCFAERDSESLTTQFGKGV